MTDYQVPFQKKSSAKEVRRRAWDALKGYYWLAFGVFFLATVLGSFAGGYVSVSFEDFADRETLERLFGLLGDGSYRELARELLELLFGSALLRVVLLSAVISTLTSCAFSILVGSPADVGYAKFNLDIIDGDQKPEWRDLFYGFRTCYFGAVRLRLLRTLIFGGCALLWQIPAIVTLHLLLSGAERGALLTAFAVTMVLLVIGVTLMVVLSHVYALSYDILAEYPTLGAIYALRNSRLLMRGNKLRLFRLNLSFLGWIILAALAGGIGELFLAPYLNCAEVAFYSEVSGRETAKAVEFPSLDPEDYFSDEQ